MARVDGGAVGGGTVDGGGSVVLVVVTGGLVVAGASVVVALVVGGAGLVVDGAGVVAAIGADVVAEPVSERPPLPQALAASATVSTDASSAKLRFPVILDITDKPSRYRLAFAAIAAGLAAVACGSSPSPRAAPPPSAASTVTSTTRPPVSTTSTTRPPTTTTTRPPGPPSFEAVVSAPLIPGEVSHTWRAGCPVPPAQLRMIHMTYWGFDNHAHTGSMVVNEAVVADVETVFRALYSERFPIHEMVPEDAYGGNDNLAAAADDTSGFNCRDAVAPGPPQWSVHAYGEAIDVNDVQNPYIDGSLVIPPAGEAYFDRRDVRPGMAVPGGQLVEAFASVGWQWGGRWTVSPDYQHFSLTGG